ncbi:hemolysin family protein [uncultured Odoribacter sp.]|uniref:hemolysin family protein n=1 Tax=uncultured Odoribacter sp. TaxID=876416 RepID=UPI00262455D5|nr:hemolysin family protein [uncultured Odoribacter sp.]
MEILIIVILLLINGVFAMYEIALVSSSKARLETMVQNGSKKAARVLKLLEEPEKILSTIQVGITLIGIISGAYGGVALAGDLVPLFEKIPGLEIYAGKLAMVTVVGTITYLSLIIGELVPKSLALNHPEKIAVFFTSFMCVLTRITYPFVWFLSISTKVVNKLFGIKTGENRPMTEEELKFILHQSSEEGVIDKEETEMLKDVFRFSDKRAEELMTYRKEIVFLNTTDTKEKVLETIRREHYSKYLLCEGSVDKCLGVVSVKDIVALLGGGGTFDLQKVVQEPLFVPENLPAIRVLELFKKYKTKFGMVVSEYGDITGIITLHDLTESIFGDILEEGEEPEAGIVVRKDGSFLVDGAMNVDDFMDEMGIVLYEDIAGQDFTTLSGMAMFFLRSVPKEGDVFYYRNLKFEVMDMDSSRVDKLLVTKTKELSD